MSIYSRSFARTYGLLVSLTAALVGLSGCGGGASSPPLPPPPTSTITSVTVSPVSAALFVKGTQQFTASVQGTGSFNPTVTWYVNDVQGGNTTFGTINSAGSYTAPSTVPNPASLTIKAKSVQDITKSGPATVIINPENVQISISPTSGSVQLGTPLQFSATVSGTGNTSVLWSVNGLPGGQPSIGLIDQSGLYTAPANLPANTVTVSATSQEDTTKAAAAIVTILATAGGITVTVSPQNPNLVFDGSQSIQFTATVTGTSNTSVTWSVDQNYSAIGQISASGLFTPSVFNCTNVPGPGVVRAVSAANPGAQGFSTVNLVPPAPTITALSPQPADAQATLQVSGHFAVGGTFAALYPGPNGATIPGAVTTTSQTSLSGPVPLGTARGPFAIQQSCGPGTATQNLSQQSNSLPFRRLPRLRVRANRQVLASGESTPMLAAFMGDQTPQPLTWSALFGAVTANGIFTAGSTGWDKVTGCITGTQQCDSFVFSIVPARINPVAPVVPIGATLQLSEVPSTTSPAWTIEAGGGSVTSTGLYTAPTALQDTGAIPIIAGNATTAISVVGGFPGLVNRIIDYPDISANATGQTTLPKSVAVDGKRVYVLSDNLPGNIANGHYRWIDAYDASDAAHPVWTGAVEGFDPDLNQGFVQSMDTFASGGLLWRVTVPSINGNPTASPEVAVFDSTSGQPVLKHFYTTPELCADGFYQGVLIGIACSFTSTGQTLWQSPVTALMFDGRTGTVVQSQVTLALPNPSIPVSFVGILATQTRIFVLLTQQQTDGSQPLFLSSYDLTVNPPQLLQTIPAQTAPVFLPGQSALQIFGNTLFAGAGIYDIASGLPVLSGQIETVPPADMNGSLALVGPLPDDRYSLVDYSSLANPKPTGLLFNSDTFQGPARFVGNHAYIAASGVQIVDVSAPAGGPISRGELPGPGNLSAINDLLVNSLTLYAAENTDFGEFVTSFDIGSVPASRIAAFKLTNNEVPLAFAISGNFLFVGTSTDLVVLDVTDPSSPVKVASLAQPASALTLVGTLLYAGTPDNHLVIINVSNPASPVAGPTFGIAGYPVEMQAKGDLLLIAADTAGLLTYSIANPSAPTLLSQFQPSSAVVGVALDGISALLAAADGGFVVADMTNPATPVLTAQVPLAILNCFADLDPTYPPALVSVSNNNGIAYVGSFSMSGRVFGFDYRQTAHPRLVSASNYGGAIDEAILTFAFSGSNMYVAGDFTLNASDSVYVSDVTQPRNFIRQMCNPSPFGPAATAASPMLKTDSTATSTWNFKARSQSRQRQSR